MKTLIGLFLVCSFALAFVACDGGKKAKEEAAKRVADSTRIADSLASIAAEQRMMFVEDSTRVADSLAQIKQ